MKSNLPGTDEQAKIIRRLRSISRNCPISPATAMPRRNSPPCTTGPPENSLEDERMTPSKKKSLREPPPARCRPCAPTPRYLPDPKRLPARHKPEPGPAFRIVVVGALVQRCRDGEFEALSGRTETPAEAVLARFPGDVEADLRLVSGVPVATAQTIPTLLQYLRLHTLRLNRPHFPIFLVNKLLRLERCHITEII